MWKTDNNNRFIYGKSERKITRFLILTAIIISQSCYGQIDMDYHNDCFVIQFEKKNSSVPDSLILPVYQEHGFQIIENGVYDFIIDGKKYFQALLLNINSLGFKISKNWEFFGEEQIIKDTSLSFLSTQDIKIRMVTIDQGRGGLPFTVGSKDYVVKFMPSSKYCRLKNSVITTGPEIVQGHYYFTGYGWKKIKIVSGKPYLCDETGEFQLRRN